MDEQSIPSTEPIERVLEQLNAGAVFGRPTKQGDVTVIPVAEVSVALGYGLQTGGQEAGIIAVQVQEVNFGGGGAYSIKRGLGEASTEGHEGEASVADTADTGAASSEGAEGHAASGGARGRVKPRGYVLITPDGVSFHDIIDITRLGLAGIAMVAWSTYWVSKTIRAAARTAGKKDR